MTKEERLIKLMQHIDDKYIDEAYATINFDNKHMKENKRNILKSVVAVAACICLLAICVPLLQQKFISTPEKPGSSAENNITTINNMDAIDYIPTLTYNNYLYAIFESSISPTVLKLINYEDSESFFSSKGVPSTITNEMIGRHLCYLSVDNERHFIQSDSETGIELFEYAPAPYCSVYIIKQENSYLYAFIDNIELSSDDHADFSFLYGLYGINGTEDVDSIYITDNNYVETVSDSVTDSDCLQEFFTLSTNLQFYSETQFSLIMYDILDSEEIESLTDVVDKNHVNICIQSSSGLKFHIKYYPEYGWLYSNITNGYYKVGDELITWLYQNLM